MTRLLNRGNQDSGKQQHKIISSLSMKAQRLRKTAKLLRRRNCWVMLVTVADHKNNSISHFIGLLKEIPSTMDQWTDQFTLHILGTVGYWSSNKGSRTPVWWSGWRQAVALEPVGSGVWTNNPVFMQLASPTSGPFPPFALSLTWVSDLCFNEFLLWNACSTSSSSSICNSLYYWTGFTSLFASLLRLWKHLLCLYRVFSCCMEADRAQKKALLLGNG